jgi:hypothetical protein
MINTPETMIAMNGSVKTKTTAKTFLTWLKRRERPWGLLRVLNIA